jgi:hypothetical protein
MLGRWDAGMNAGTLERWNDRMIIIVVVSWKDGIDAGTLERRNDGMTVVVVVVENDDEHEILGYNKILLLLLLLRIHENLLGHWSSMD